MNGKTAQDGKKSLAQVLGCDSQPGLRAQKRARLASETRQVDLRFRAVRLGLSIGLTVLFLLAFSLLYVRPGHAAFYVCVLTLGFDLVLLTGLMLLGRSAAGRYRRTQALRRELEDVTDESPY